MGNFGIDALMSNDGFDCDCGRKHFKLLRDCIIGENALNSLVELIQKYSVCHPFILCDSLTYAAAGKNVTEILESNGITYTIHVIERINPAPDEKIVGEALMYCENECDMVIAVGGGVINDTCKIIASAKNVPDIFVATAPSMDGFASATSSMERGGFKLSLNSKCPEAVIGDADVLASAPRHLICAGIGDMIAKYISIAEWKIASVILGEYYCETVADVVRSSLSVCMENAFGTISGDKASVSRLTEGLVISGMAMNYVGISRPASGMEHYISHIIDMRSLEFGTKADYHGIQCGLATLTTLRAYERLAEYTPDKNIALSYVSSFDDEEWNQRLRQNLGRSAETIILAEIRDQKYNKEKHAARIEIIIENWDEITRVIRTLPSSKETEAFMRDIGHPTSYTEIGLTAEEYKNAFLMAKDVRDKYVLGRLLWDLGLLDEYSNDIK